MDKLVVATADPLADDEPPVPLDANLRPVAYRPAAERARALVAQHFDFIWRLLRRLGVPEGDVDDAAQQVFIVASRRLGDIAEGCERTFLFGTALRTAATVRRNLRRRQRWVETSHRDAPSEESSPDEVVERRQALAVLDEVLRALSDEQRVVFVLCELEELTVAEAATVIGIAAGTAASRLRRAREEFGHCVRRLRAKRMRCLRE
jgi:RNA polymerase sigma-70 factor (ECF subfamily)